VEDGSGAKAHASHSSVLVVGGGVSGTACAGTLASRGLDVRLLSGALDSLGVAEYSPCFLPAGAGEERLLLGSKEPAGLGRAWFENMWALPGASWGVVDRRRVSIRLKEWVEEIGVELRQGLATTIARVPQGWLVGTAFGESFTAEVAVLSVGLSLGGHHLIGEREFPGARIGEVPSEGLLQALKAHGAVFDTGEERVGPRLWRLPDSIPPFLRRVQLRPAGTLRGGAKPGTSRLAFGRGPRTAGDQYGAEYLEAWLAPTPPLAGADVAVGQTSECPVGLFPDGAATGEWYVSPGLEQQVVGAPLSRRGYVVRGLVFGGEQAQDTQERCATREVMEGLWATGWLAGAGHTSASLLSGIACADAVERVIRQRDGRRAPR